MQRFILSSFFIYTNDIKYKLFKYTFFTPIKENRVFLLLNILGKKNIYNISEKIHVKNILHVLNKNIE